MNRYIFSVTLQVEVPAFSDGDAIEAVRDAFGEGEFCGVEVTQVEIV